VKLLRRLFSTIRPAFEEKGKLHAFKILFETVEGVVLGVMTRTKTAPHVRDPLDIKRYMGMVLLALLPSVFCSFYFFGLRMIPVFIVSYAVGGLIEVAFALVRKEEINEGFLVTGLIYPLVLPPGLPLWMVGAGVAFGVIVGKEIFGGTGRNVFNPALVGRCFLALSYAKVMVASYLVPASEGLGNLTRYVTVETVDAVSSATPLSAAKAGSMESVMSLMWGNVSGSAGETSAIAIIAGGLFLLLTRVANYRTTVSMLGSFAALGALLHHLSPATFGPIGWHMLAGGLLFGAFFMATDPVTSPATNGAKWMYGTIIGVSTLLIRNLSGYVEGVMFAILLGNIAAPVLDEIVVRMRLRRLAYES
jgi:Na(+)-translocating NADH:ubiquinone oxidoreductase B subunit